MRRKDVVRDYIHTRPLESKKAPVVNKERAEYEKQLAQICLNCTQSRRKCHPGSCVRYATEAEKIKKQQTTEQAKT